MRALVAAAAAMVTLLAGSPALAVPPVPQGAEGPAASGAPTGSSSPSMARTKAPPLRVVKVSQRRLWLGGQVVVTGRTRAESRAVRLQLRRRTQHGVRWVTVDRARSQRGRFVLGATVRRTRVDGLRVVAPRSRRATRVASPAVRLRVLERQRPVRRSQKPRAATPTPAPVPGPGSRDEGLEAASVQDELARRVRDHRAAYGRTEVGGDACLAAWASDFATAMARTGVFAHSGSSEWGAAGARPAGAGRVVPAVEACRAGTPVTYRQEAIARVTGATPVEVAQRALADLRAAWMHDAVLLDDTGTGRVMEVGAARDTHGEWFVVVVLAAA